MMLMWTIRNLEFVLILYVACPYTKRVWHLKYRLHGVFQAAISTNNVSRLMALTGMPIFFSKLLNNLIK